MHSNDAQIGNAEKVGLGGIVDPASPELSFDAPSIGNIRGCLRNSMGGKYQVETEAGLLRRGDFPCQRAGGMMSFVLSF